MGQTTGQRPYEQDFVAWCEDTAAKLKLGHLDTVDIEGLIEEIEGLAGRDRRELKNRLEVLLYHLLKRLYVPAPEAYRGWELTIREQRRRLQDLLDQSPSLRHYFMDVLPVSWANALADAREDYPQTIFPDHWPYTPEVESLLNEKPW